MVGFLWNFEYLVNWEMVMNGVDSILMEGCLIVYILFKFKKFIWCIKR